MPFSILWKQKHLSADVTIIHRAGKRQVQHGMASFREVSIENYWHYYFIPQKETMISVFEIFLATKILLIAIGLFRCVAPDNLCKVLFRWPNRQ